MKCMNLGCRRFAGDEDNNCMSYLDEEMYMCSHKILVKKQPEPIKEVCNVKNLKRHKTDLDLFDQTLRPEPKKEVCEYTYNKREQSYDSECMHILDFVGDVTKWKCCPCGKPIKIKGE